MAANVAVAQDPAGNLKPAKGKSTERIDGIVALIMAIGAMLPSEQPFRSVYEDRGILVL
jgi:phage terminase large subunit-like protein